MIVEGVEWITTGQACERLAPDVGSDTLRNWRRGGRVRVLRDTAGHPVRLNRQLLVCWPDVVEAERAARAERAGRPRNANVSEPLQTR